MKKQLLEDFGDSQSSMSPPPVRRRAPAATSAPVPAADRGARARAGVWRSRAPAAPPAFPAPAQPRVSSAPHANPAPPPEIASFSSRQPDWTVPVEADTMPWTERWGRKALGWSLALAGVVAVAGTAAWMVRETKVESTLAIVADHSPAPAVPPAAAVPVAQAGAYKPPPLKLLPPEAPASVAVPVKPASEPPPEAALSATAPAAAPAVAALPEKTEAAPPPPVKKKPAAQPAPQRRLAAAAAKRDKPVARKTAKPKAPSGRVLARALADAQRSRQESLARPAPLPDPGPSQPAATGALAETLRLCRAAGYHATACIKRGCEATRFGLVCRG